SYAQSLAIADLDGDGAPDLAVANAGSNTLSVLRNTGCGELAGADPAHRPTRFGLLGVFPNPFRTALAVRFALPEQRRVDVAVFDVAGRRVCSLANGQAYPAGEHMVVWDRRARNGAAPRAGLYLVHVQAGSEHAVARVILLN